jgi:hypothetical protein
MMSDIDERIRGALDADDKAFLAQLEDDRGLFRQLGDSMGGTLGGWAKLIFALTFMLAALMFYCGWQAIVATELRETVLWATGVVVLVMSVGFMKDWLFSRINMLTVLREVKRLEVLVAARD